METVVELNTIQLRIQYNLIMNPIIIWELQSIIWKL